jgi:hypothetical protein
MREMEMSTKTPMERIQAVLDEDARLRGEATPGPWEIAEDSANGKDEAWCYWHRVGPIEHGGEKATTNDHFIVHARNTDLGFCLRIAVEALRQIAASAVKEEALYGWEVRYKNEALEALAQIAALLPDEEK